jgi:ZIP family zinc transporter
VDLPTGITTAALMSLHNIPEGIAITASALLAGFSRLKSLLLTLTATLAEMLGATAIYLSGSLFLDLKSTGALLSFVAGIMLAICVKELLPFSYKTLRPSSR